MLRPLLRPAAHRAVSTASAVALPRGRGLVNAHHVPDHHTPTPMRPRDNSFDASAVSSAHWSEAPWPTSELRAAQSKHVVSTWGVTAPAESTPLITRAEGVYMWDADGKQYLDWTSQAVCSNLGHDVPPAVVDAITAQLRSVPFVYSGIGMTEVRCRMAQLMAEILPGDRSEE